MFDKVVELDGEGSANNGTSPSSFIAVFNSRTYSAWKNRLIRLLPLIATAIDSRMCQELNFL